MGLHPLRLDLEVRQPREPGATGTRLRSPRSSWSESEKADQTIGVGGPIGAIRTRFGKKASWPVGVLRRARVMRL